MIYTLLSVAIIPALISAQCLTLNTTCRVCTTPRNSNNLATSLRNCHVSSKMSKLIPAFSGSVDTVGNAYKWYSYSNAIAPTTSSSFCSASTQAISDVTNMYHLINADGLKIHRGQMTGPLNEANYVGNLTRITVTQARSLYKTLGCFLHMQKPAGWGIHWGFHIDTKPLHLVPFMNHVIDMTSYANDGDTMKALSDIIRWKTFGKSIFSSQLHEFAFMVITYGYKYTVSLSIFQERLTYIHWTFMNQALLTLNQKKKYYAYQKGDVTSLPRRASTSTNILPLETLRATCPLANSYLTTGCLIYVAINCETESAICKPSYQAIDLLWRPVASEALTSACGNSIAEATFPNLCSSAYKSW